MGVIVIRIEANTAALDALARSMPGVYRKACGRAAAGLRTKLRAILRRGGGADGVPRLAGRAHGFPAQGRPILQGASVDLRNMIKAWRSPNHAMQYIGWPHRLQDFVGNLLDAENREWTQFEAEWVPRRSRSAFLRGYARPARAVIEPFTAYVRANLSRMVAGAANRMLAKMDSRP